MKGHAETGSGKTMAFVVPILDRVLRMERLTEYKMPEPMPIAIVIEPTHELCAQVYEQFRKLADGRGSTAAEMIR
jgi:superfamily II DNA/RNA helicase